MAPSPAPRPPPPAGAWVVVARWSAAGDIVLTLPAVAALAAAWPEARILYATHARFAGLLRGVPQLAQVLELAPGERIGALARRLAARAPAAFLDLHGKARGRALSCLFRRLPRAQVGGRGLGARLATSLGGARCTISPPPARAFHRAVEALVGRPLPASPLALRAHPDDRRAAAGHLQAAGGRPPAGAGAARRVGMAPGAAWATKMWPAEHFAALAQRLLAAGHQVVLTGSPAELPLCRRVQALAPAVQVLAGRGDLGVAVGLIDHCDAFVANDSGPMHIARALGVPTLALFACTDPAQFDLPPTGLATLGLSCSPCTFYGRRRCPRGHHLCARGLQVEAVWQRLGPLLSGPRRLPPPAF